MSNSRNPAAPVVPRADDADALLAWARHALAANGFGDADAALASQPERPPAGAQRVAHAPRAYRLSEIAAALGASLVDAVSDAWRRAQRRRDLRATLHALSELDASTLRDIGLPRGEIGLATELAGVYEPTRARALLALRSLAV